MKEDTKDIKLLSELLTRENKQYVIAVANALLFPRRGRRRPARQRQGAAHNREWKGDELQPWNR